MFIMRDGTQVADIRLGRLVNFDERSRNYPIRTLVEEQPLRSYSWDCNAWFDQGKEGACVAFSLGHELAAQPVEVQGLTNEILVENFYWEIQKTDPWEGGSYPGANPVYEGTSVLCGLKFLQDKGLIQSYRWAFNLNDVLLGIGYNGPCEFGINWYSDMYEPDSKGFIHPTGQLVGGHAIIGRAVDIENKFVTLHNSWGQDWGINGDCYISFEDLEKLLKEDGEAAFVVDTPITKPEDTVVTDLPISPTDIII